MEPLSITESSPDSRVYTGVWINWSHGIFFGRTLTVKRQDGDLLIAFVALFVTVVGTSFWRISCFAIHYYYSSEAPQDGVYHQRQAILRNSANSASGLWHLIRTVCAWRKNGTTTITRVYPVIAHATLCLGVFGAASGFSSKVSTSVGNEVLISSTRFGVPNTTNLPTIDMMTRVFPSRSKQLRSYNTYAEQCYTNQSRLAGCDTFVKPYLASQVNRNAHCPFKSQICRSHDQNIYLDTGLLDISDDFGMNVPPSQRFQFRVVTHCAPLKTEGYKKSFPVMVQSLPDTDANYKTIPAYVEYVYGRSLLAENATYVYPDSALSLGNRENPTYTINFKSAHPQNGTFDRSTAEFIPNEDLIRTDADLDLVFLSANEVLYSGIVDDPWYSAHKAEEVFIDGSDPILVYWRDEPAAVLGCVKQYQICNPRLSKGQGCTPLQGSQDLETNAYEIVDSEQEAAWLNFYLMSRFSELPQLRLLSMLGSSCLASSYSFYDSLQVPLPDFQWQLDVEHWHSIYLASLQGSAIDIAEGPSDPKLRELMQKPQSKEEKAFCLVQKVRSDKHTNFSVFGLAMMFSIGIITILLSWFIEPLVAFIQKRRNLDAYARLEWTTNEVLQLQRMAHEQLEMGTWSACDTEVPITERGEKLAVLDLGNLNHPRLVAPPRGFEHELSEPKNDDPETGGHGEEAEQAIGDSSAGNDKNELTSGRTPTLDSSTA